MDAAAHKVAVWMGGAIGFLMMKSSKGAIAGGVVGGAVLDSIITAYYSLAGKEFCPHGMFEIIADPKNPGKWCLAFEGVVIDAMTGLSAEGIIKSMRTNSNGVLKETAVKCNEVVKTKAEKELKVVPEEETWLPLQKLMKFAGPAILAQLVQIRTAINLTGEGENSGAEHPKIRSADEECSMQTADRDNSHDSHRERCDSSMSDTSSSSDFMDARDRFEDEESSEEDSNEEEHRGLLLDRRRLPKSSLKSNRAVR